MNLKKYLLLFVASTTLACATLAMEPLKTALCVTAGVTGIGLTADIIYDRLFLGDFSLLKDKNYIKTLLSSKIIPAIIATAALVPALHAGSKDQLSVSNLLQPALCTVGITTSLAALTALVTHYSADKKETNLGENATVLRNSAAMFYASTFLFAAPALAIFMYNKR